MSSQNVPTALQAFRDRQAAEAAAVDHDYPKYVTPDRAAWAGAKTVEDRNSAKVLVQNEAEHRIVAPADFADEPEAPSATAAELIEAVKASTDVEYLRGLLERESRKGVVKAIEARLAKLAE